MKKVLFVDDQQEILDLIQRKLSKTTFEKYYANTAKQALEIINEHQIDLLVTDIMMPGISGLDLITEVVKSNPYTTCIVLSGNVQMSSVMDAINEGHVYKYITKPWRIDEAAIMLIEDALEFAHIKHIHQNLQGKDNWIKIKDLKMLNKMEKWLLTDEDGEIIMSSGNFKLSEKTPGIDYMEIKGLDIDYRAYRIL